VHSFVSGGDQSLYLSNRRTTARAHNAKQKRRRTLEDNVPIIRPKVRDPRSRRLRLAR